VHSSDDIRLDVHLLTFMLLLSDSFVAVVMLHRFGLPSFPHRVWMVGRASLALFASSYRGRRLLHCRSRSCRYTRFLGERVFGLHFADHVVRSERGGLLSGMPSR